MVDRTCAEVWSPLGLSPQESHKPFLFERGVSWLIPKGSAKGAWGSWKGAQVPSKGEMLTQTEAEHISPAVLGIQSCYDMQFPLHFNEGFTGMPHSLMGGMKGVAGRGQGDIAGFARSQALAPKLCFPLLGPPNDKLNLKGSHLGWSLLHCQRRGSASPNLQMLAYMY